jgi:hypothetical protein
LTTSLRDRIGAALRNIIGAALLAGPVYRGYWMINSRVKSPGLAAFVGLVSV